MRRFPSVARYGPGLQAVSTKRVECEVSYEDRGVFKNTCTPKRRPQHKTPLRGEEIRLLFSDLKETDRVLQTLRNDRVRVGLLRSRADRRECVSAERGGCKSTSSVESPRRRYARASGRGQPSRFMGLTDATPRRTRPSKRIRRIGTTTLRTNARRRNARRAARSLRSSWRDRCRRPASLSRGVAPCRWPR